MEKEKIITSMEFMYDRPPSKWDMALIIRFKKVMLEAINYLKGKEDIVEAAKREFDIKEEGGSQT